MTVELEVQKQEPTVVVYAGDNVETTGAVENGQKKKSKRPRNKKPRNKVPVQENAESSPVDEEDYHKVFVGNLSFNIKEEELQNYFGQAGVVLGANIIQRADRFGRPSRSAGYGFVTFETQEMAEEAVRLLDKTECLDRMINVERTSARAERERTRPRRERNHVRAPRDGEESENPQTTEGAEDVEGEDKIKEEVAKPRPKRKNNRRRAVLQAEENVKKEVDAIERETDVPVTERKRAPRTRRPRKQRDLVDGEEAAAGEEANDHPRERKPRITRPRGPPSEKTLFVANLPFSLTDDGLSELFKDFKISSAHVVPRKGTNRNKGFGFVELENHDEQLRAVKILQANSINTDGRDLAVKVALEEIRDEQNDTESAEPARIDAE